MSALTDYEIRVALGRDIVIHPLVEQHITATGYDISLGVGTVLLATGSWKMAEEIDGVSVLTIPKRTSAVLVTAEQIWLSNNIIGTIHSRGTLSARGLVLNSTTVDPNWTGALVLRIFNMTDNDLGIRLGERIATLMFHRATTGTRSVAASAPRAMLPVFVPHDAARAALSDHVASFTTDFNDEVARARSLRLVLDSMQSWIARWPAWLSRSFDLAFAALLVTALVGGLLSLVAWSATRSILIYFGNDPGPANSQTMVASAALVVSCIVGLRQLGRK